MQMTPPIMVGVCPYHSELVLWPAEPVADTRQPLPRTAGQKPVQTAHVGDRTQGLPGAGGLHSGGEGQCVSVTPSSRHSLPPH